MNRVELYELHKDLSLLFSVTHNTQLWFLYHTGYANDISGNLFSIIDYQERKLLFLKLGYMVNPDNLVQLVDQSSTLENNYLLNKEELAQKENDIFYRQNSFQVEN